MGDTGIFARLGIRFFTFALLLVPGVSLAGAGGPTLEFQRVALDSKFHSEGVAVGDFNRDGKMDIAASDVYYAAPDWKPVAIMDPPREYDPHNYSNSFCNFADDVNGDGWTDLLVVDFPGKETWWCENSQNAPGPWKRHACVPETNNESPQYLDLNGDGKRELLFGAGDRMAFARPGSDPHAPWSIRTVSAAMAPGTHKFSHGLGAGDVNSDGRQDILVNTGWWEAPADDSAAEWTYHPADLGDLCAQMYVHDWDGDGDADVLSSSAHQIGIWWHEQTKEGWQEHEIDTSFSQTHALCVADMNGDGMLDFVTGKRWWAHGPSGDIGSDQPAVLYWFEFQRADGKPTWTKHLIDRDSGVGTQFEVADVNGDGLLDVVSANKKGAHYFQQVRR